LAYEHTAQTVWFFTALKRKAEVNIRIKKEIRAPTPPDDRNCSYSRPGYREKKETGADTRNAVTLMDPNK
jgi:hypothetical protein